MNTMKKIALSWACMLVLAHTSFGTTPANEIHPPTSPPPSEMGSQAAIPFSTSPSGIKGVYRQGMPFQQILATSYVPALKQTPWFQQLSVGSSAVDTLTETTQGKTTQHPISITKTGPSTFQYALRISPAHPGSPTAQAKAANEIHPPTSPHPSEMGSQAATPFSTSPSGIKGVYRQGMPFQQVLDTSYVPALKQTPWFQQLSVGTSAVDTLTETTQGKTTQHPISITKTGPSTFKYVLEISRAHPGSPTAQATQAAQTPPTSIIIHGTPSQTRLSLAINQMSGATFNERFQKAIGPYTVALRRSPWYQQQKPGTMWEETIAFDNTNGIMDPNDKNPVVGIKLKMMKEGAGEDKS